MKLFITGFSAFDDVVDNPTEKLVKKLNDALQGPDLIGAEVLEASGDYVRKSLSQFYEQVQESNNISDDTLVVLHLGHDKLGDAFKFESSAYNEASFRCPDERGWMPLHERINPRRELRAILQSDLPLGTLHSRCANSNCSSVISENPGRFICNYTYYMSLAHCRELQKSGKNVHTMFVHVPSFNAISEPEQTEFLVGMVGELKQIVSMHEEIAVM